jgi:drug/metabolite transporter (DMT)-like permease
MSTTSGQDAGRSDRDRPLFAITLKIIAMLLFSLMFACVKWVGTSVPVGEVVFFRSFFGMLIIVAAAFAMGGREQLATRRAGTHAVRSLLGIIGMFCNFIAVTYLPLADATVIAFAAPLFTVILAALFLGENVHIYRWSAVVIGFGGVLIIAAGQERSGNMESMFGAVLGLTGAGLAATAMVVIRRMSVHEHSEAIAFYFMLTSTAVSLLTIPWGWAWPPADQLSVLILMGVLGGVAQLFLTFGYRYGEASVLAPFDYTTLVSAVALGYFLFGDLPTFQGIIGAVLGIGAGRRFLWRERVLRQRRLARAASNLIG